MEKLQGVYWLTIEPENQHRSLAAALESHEFGVTFFKTLDSLTNQLKTQRAPIIIVGDEGPEIIVVKAISLLSTMPELQGVRLILSVSRHSPVVMRAAACEGFRDIIPVSLEAGEWTRRFLFSTSGSEARLPGFHPHLSMESEASLAIPARVVRVSDDQIRVESHITPTRGARFDLTGPLAQAMGYKRIPLEVISHRKDNLSYRFSVAIQARWLTKEPRPALVQETMAIIKEMDTGAREKTFLAVQSPALRATLIRHLDTEIFNIQTALTRSSMVEEPRYFCPTLVFVEDRLCSGDHQNRFREMVLNLPKKARIVLVGGGADPVALKNLAGGRELIHLKRIPVNLQQTILNDILKRGDEEPAAHDGWYIPADHEFSLAELNMSCTLTAVHPVCLEITSRYPAGVFGLTRIESPFIRQVLGRDPWAKIIHISEDKINDRIVSWRLMCYFSDLDPERKDKLADALIGIASRNLRRPVGDQPDLLAAALQKDEKQPAPPAAGSAAADTGTIAVAARATGTDGPVVQIGEDALAGDVQIRPDSTQAVAASPRSGAGLKMLMILFGFILGGGFLVWFVTSFLAPEQDFASSDLKAVSGEQAPRGKEKVK